MYDNGDRPKTTLPNLKQKCPGDWTNYSTGAFSISVSFVRGELVKPIGNNLLTTNALPNPTAAPTTISSGQWTPTKILAIPIIKAAIKNLQPHFLPPEADI